MYKSYRNKYPQRKNVIRIFQCYNTKENEHKSYKNILQGIMYPSGQIKIGVDVWRDLNKHDCSSHEVILIGSTEELYKKYTILKKGGKKDVS